MLKDQTFEFLSQLFVELRKEILSSQRVRTQVMGFKITFVSAAIGVLLARRESIPNELLLIPAFSSIFFDFLINSHSFNIKRIGFYIRTKLEPALRKGCELPHDLLLYEEYLSTHHTRQRFALYGNLGITVLSLVPAIWALFNPFRFWPSLTILLLLVALSVCDVLVHLTPGVLIDKGPKPKESDSVFDAE